MAHFDNLPKHVAIIMDGNGRWAIERGLPRIEGHRRGVESIREVVRTAREIGIKYLTLYAFSRENWARPSAEVKFLMNLLSDYLDSELDEILQNDIRFHVIGRTEDLPSQVIEKIERNITRTKSLRGMTLTLALSYSARMEILDAVRNICRKIRLGELFEDELTEDRFSNELYTAGMPDPDLLIRTSGEFRISNFLLWQISYAELVVSPKFWPEFRKADFLSAIENYQKRERRFGRTEAVHHKRN